MTLNIPRKTYVDLFGPTVGDRIRLADTDLIIEIEKDLNKYVNQLFQEYKLYARQQLSQYLRKLSYQFHP